MSAKIGVFFSLIGISVRMGGYEDLDHHGNSRRINRVLTMALKEGDARKGTQFRTKF